MESELVQDAGFSGSFTIFLLSTAMLIGCYVAGSIPLAFSLSEDRLHLVSVLGAGLLIGTALAVIIPEGVNALYLDNHNHKSHDHSHHVGSGALEGTMATGSKVLADVAASPDRSIDVHTLIGFTLVLGFVFMMLIDQLSAGSSHSHSGCENSSSHNITATLGLVVHAAADGVALGAAARSSHTEVEMIVFIAIMLHKAPAAFGLVTFLLSEGLDRGRIRRHLLVFAAAAPVTALLTYFGLSAQSKQSLASSHTTGAAMLFSAGTFLYVSTVHVLPEITRLRPHAQGSSSNLELGRNGSTGVGHFNKKELFVIVLGALFPMLLSLGHHH